MYIFNTKTFFKKIAKDSTDKEPDKCKVKILRQLSASKPDGLHAPLFLQLPLKQVLHQNHQNLHCELIASGPAGEFCLQFQSFIL